MQDNAATAAAAAQARMQRGGYGGCNPPKFIRSEIFWVNLWQLYYSYSTVFKFCTSMWLFSALAPALYKGCGTNSWLHDTESHKNFAPDFLLKVFYV